MLRDEDRVEIADNLIRELWPLLGERLDPMVGRGYLPEDMRPDDLAQCFLWYRWYLLSAESWAVREWR